MSEQYITRTVTVTNPKHPDYGSDVEMIEAQFATGKRHTFEKWHLEAVNGKAYPESELVEYEGAWYLPENLKDELHDEVMKGSV
jgi:hypothetical protein